MKKLYITIFLLVSTFLNAQIVTIPDINFKNALIEEGVDTNNDGEIQVTEAEAVLSLYVGFKNISSLDGIQSFINIEFLNCGGNELTNLDVSQNTSLIRLWCPNNQLTALDVSQNLNLETLWCWNNLLANLDVAQNLNLKGLACPDNQLISLDVSQNINLEYLGCSDNQLNSLLINNGNNHNMFDMFSTGNVNLSCIQVDDENATYPECGGPPIVGWCKDEWSSYSENCSVGIAEFKEFNFNFYPNPAKNEMYLSSKKIVGNLKIKIFNIEGKLLSNQNLDFEKEVSMDVSNLANGIYFLNIEDENGNTVVKKFIKG